MKKKKLIKQKFNSEGFTLIELLVVISIISLLASVILVTANNTRISARDAKRIADIAQIQKALEFYHNDFGVYPASGGALANNPNAAWTASNDSSWATFQNTMAKYIASLPHDPKEYPSGTCWAACGGNLDYGYFSGLTGVNNPCGNDWYMIVYQLEKPSGPDYGFTPPCVTTLGGLNPSGAYQYGGGGASTAVKTVGGK